ncbi:DUF6745 domain-containing protein [Nocardia sp. NPDC051832]|uniref:DUF6745 domain-containing protein n=1 Tax=Nocardia sp. NPDC051832 TaxID=3155673 RepID=UPI0034216324
MSVLAQRHAATIREEWLGVALSTMPADRPAAEAAISELYRLIGLRPPRFRWVSSPFAALHTGPPGQPGRKPEFTVTQQLSALRAGLQVDIDGQHGRLGAAANQAISEHLLQSLSQTVTRMSSLITAEANAEVFSRDFNWQRTLSVVWLAHAEAVRRIGNFAVDERITLWEQVARSCGWWWPQPEVCVISERPVLARTEVSDERGELRLHCPDGPALRYRDGWTVHAWHGTRVPEWVLADPTVARIDAEVNVEVRRCAIERFGWPAYIEEAGMRLIATAPDPGNPGFELRLYDMRRSFNVLVAVNGSLERDGTRRRYGLTVPGGFTDPVAAAGWTYGLTGAQYALLQRRT